MKKITDRERREKKKVSKNTGDIQTTLAEHLHGTIFGVKYLGIVDGMIRDGTMGCILKYRSFEDIEIPIPKELMGVKLEQLIELGASTISVAETPVSQIKHYFGMKELQKQVDEKKQ